MKSYAVSTECSSHYGKRLTPSWAISLEGV